MSRGDSVHAGASGMSESALGGEVTVEFGVSGTKVEAVLPLEWAAVK